MTKKESRLIKSLNKEIKQLCDLIGLPDDRLEYVGAKSLGHEYAHSIKESNGKVYHYPETITVSFSAYSKHCFSYRVKDGRWIPEGSSLNRSKGLKRFQVMRIISDDLKDWKRVIDDAEKPKAAVFSIKTGKRVA